MKPSLQANSAEAARNGAKVKELSAQLGDGEYSIAGTARTC